MTTLLTAMFAALLMVGCGEAQGKQISKEVKDAPPIPLLIPCEACKKKVSKRSTACPNCEHPTPDSVVAYKKAQELARIRRGEEAAAAKKRFEERERQYGVIIAEAIDFKKFQRRVKEGELIWYYEQTPYSGWEKKIHDNGQIEWLIQVRDGKRDGLGTRWYGNGRKRWEQTYKENKLITAVVWKPNGEKCPHINVVNGNGVVVTYRNDGAELYRKTFKESKVVETKYPESTTPTAPPP